MKTNEFQEGGSRVSQDGLEGQRRPLSCAEGTVPLFPFDTDPLLDVDEYGLALRERGEVVEARLASGDRLWLALSYRTVRQVFTDPRFSNAAAVPHMRKLVPGIADPNMLVAMDAPDHARIRGLLAKAFTPKSVAELTPRVEKLAEDLVTELIRHGPPSDLVAHVSAPLALTVICELLEIPFEDRDKFRDWTERILSVGASPDEAKDAFGQVSDYFGQAIAEKLRRPGKDIISRLMSSGDDSHQISPVELRSALWFLLLTGHEAVMNTVPCYVLTLLRHPDQLRLLADQPALIPGGVEELARYVRGTSILYMRVAIEDVELGGQLIRAGELVEPMHGIGNRDSSVFAEPNRLDVTRQFPQNHLGFGMGQHFCPGSSLGRLELRIVLSVLLRRIPTMRLAVPESELSWLSGVSRGPLRMPLAWQQT